MIFGFFKKESDQEKAERLRQEQSILCLQRGELPLRAQERIAKFNADGGKLFTSDLSCNELLMLKEAGYVPISQVMGSSFVNISVMGNWITGRYTGELTDRTDALLMARQLAVGRLKEEAKQLGAHGVVGIKLDVKSYDWASRMIECTAIGTAIKIPGRAPTEHPFTSDLSGQEFWQLYEAGHWPLTLVMGISAYYVYSDLSTRNQMRNFWGGNNMSNQELHLYTKSFNSAYNLAVSRVKKQAEDVDAEGIIGSTVFHHLLDVEYESNDTTYHDLLITVTAIGTAIQTDAVTRPKRELKPLMVMDLKRGKRRLASLAREQFAPDLSDDGDDDDDE
jgi:uncharacterized protein YbjQ (UPF0145 family)